MKGVILVLSVVTSLTFYTGVLQASDKKQKVTPQEQMNASQHAGKNAILSETPEQAKIKEEQLKKAKEELGKEERIIYLSSLTDKKAKVKKDVLIFSEGKVTSKDLAEKGYPQSNCTVSIQGDGTIVWETMQSSEKGDVAFWRGELKDNVMRGILSLHPKDEKGTQDFSFNTTVPGAHEEKTEPKEKETPRKK